MDTGLSVGEMLKKILNITALVCDYAQTPPYAPPSTLMCDLSHAFYFYVGYRFFLHFVW